MITFIFDGTKMGLFTCIFDAYYEKRIPKTVTDKQVQIGFYDNVYEIVTDAQKAKRVSNCLKECKTYGVSKDVSLALKSGREDKYTVIFNYLKIVIDNKGVDVSKNFADENVLAFSDLLKQITYELHRFKGFIRFEQSVDGYYYAHFSPDNDITWLLMPHFTTRFANQAFIIHDVKRNVLGMYDGQNCEQICAEDRQVTVYLSDEEVNFKKLWQTYYKSVNIKERKNHRIMKNFLPVRYWEHLPEKQVEIASF
ncbi:MAG: TIGR03915 family putative DNA repair protein [Clostridia bacterium]|nr:TIGR03915 family putative DNA repair protein [Clostridia bacterium]